MDSDCDMGDLEVDGPGPVIENPEEHKVSNHIPEEVGEVPEKEVGNNMEVTMYNPKKRPIVYTCS